MFTSALNNLKSCFPHLASEEHALYNIWYKKFTESGNVTMCYSLPLQQGFTGAGARSDLHPLAGLAGTGPNVTHDRHCSNTQTYSCVHKGVNARVMAFRDSNKVKSFLAEKQLAQRVGQTHRNNMQCVFITQTIQRRPDGTVRRKMPL